jgi:hypothetical protein
MQVDIKKLQLGSDSAEKDIQVGLLDYFYGPFKFEVQQHHASII